VLLYSNETQLMTVSILPRIAQIIVAATGVSPDCRLDAATPLIGTGLSLDSVAVFELLVALEKEFQIEIDPDELRQTKALATVGALAAFVESKLSEPER
jgi:acyl carrier protein